MPLFDALVEDKKAPYYCIIAHMRREKHSMKLGEKASITRGKNLKEPVLCAVKSYPNGNRYKYNSQETMIPAMGQSNLI